MALTDPGNSLNFLGGSFHLELGDAQDVRDAHLRFRIYVEKSDYSFMRIAGFRTSDPLRAYSLMIFGYEGAPNADLAFRGGSTGSGDGAAAPGADGRWYQASVRLNYEVDRLVELVTLDDAVLRDGAERVSPTAPVGLSIGLYDSGSTDRNELVAWFNDIVFTRSP